MKIFERLNQIGYAKEPESDPENIVNLNTYFSTVPEGTNLLTSDDATNDRKELILALGSTVDVEKLLRWESSSRTKANQKFLFASFFVISLAFIDLTWGHGGVIYGLRVSEIVWPYLQAFLSAVVGFSMIGYLIGRFFDAWAKNIMATSIETKFVTVNEIKKKWIEDMKRRGVRVKLPVLFYGGENPSNHINREIIELFNQAATYDTQLRNASKAHKIINTIEFIIPPAAGLVAIVLLAIMEASI